MEPEDAARDAEEWGRIADTPAFRDLLAAKMRFILPATLFYLAYYIALPLLNGYAPGLMTRRVFGAVNVAYLFALSQFFMVWIVVALYLKRASVFDAMVRRIVGGARKGGE